MKEKVNPIQRKFFFGTICGVLSLVVFFLVYLRVSVFNKTYKEKCFAQSDKNGSLHISYDVTLL